MRIFHIVDPAVWAAALAVGQYRPPSIDREGFVHLSFAHQVAATANAHYRGEPELIVVEIEPDAVPHELRVEDSYGSGVGFPHLYGPIPCAAATATHELTRDSNGDWVFSPDAAGGRASTDR